MSKLLEQRRSLLLIVSPLVFFVVSVWLGYAAITPDPKNYTALWKVRSGGAEELHTAIALADTTMAVLTKSGSRHGTVQPPFGEAISLDDLFGRLEGMGNRLKQLARQLATTTTHADSTAVFAQANLILNELNGFTTFYVWRYDLYANHAVALIVWIITLFGTIRFCLELGRRR